MKKVKKILTTIISIFIFTIGMDVFAASASLSVNPSSVTAGSQFDVIVNVNSAASWNVHVFCDGSEVINQANASDDAKNTDKRWSILYTASSEGTVTCIMSGDVTDQDNGNQSISGIKTVTVTAPQNNNNNNNNNGGGTNPLPVDVVTKPTNNNNNTSNNNDKKDEKKEDKKEEPKKSSNNKIKKLTIDDYELKKINDNKYTLSVENDVDMVNVKVDAEDSKATIKGIGMHELVVGENKIEITVTAEDGSKNIVTIVVTREESDDVEEETVVKTIGTDEPTEDKKTINIIAIVMTGLNVILALAVVVLFIKNRKLKMSINKIG